MWVMLVLSIITVANRIHYTYLALNGKPIPTGNNLLTRGFSRAFFWRDERATLPYDLWVDRHPRLHLADAAGLASRPDGDRPGDLGLVLMDPATTATETAYALEALQRVRTGAGHQALSHRARQPAGRPHAALPRSRGDAARGRARRTPRPTCRTRPPAICTSWSSSRRRSASRSRRCPPGRSRAEDSRIRLRAHLAQRFPGYRVRVNRGRRSCAAIAASPTPAARR